MSSTTELPRHIIIVNITKVLLLITLILASSLFSKVYLAPPTPSKIIPNHPATSSPTSSIKIQEVKKVTTKPKSKTIMPPTPISIPLPQPKKTKETLAEIPINLRSVVVIRCTYKDYYGNQKKVFGSGVIVSPEGLILTARHVVDQEYTLSVTDGQQGFSGYNLDHCDVGQAPSGSRAPTPEEIRKLNPFYIIDVLPFTAQVQFLPDDSNWSQTEKELFDIAILRITGTNDDAKNFGITIPGAFDYSSLLKEKFPDRGEEVLTFGFPSGDPEYGSRFKIQGSIGQVKDLIGGNKEFANQLLEIAATMETIGGRSGSPLFWKGYVVGIISFKEDYSINSFATSILPLIKIKPL